MRHSIYDEPISEGFALYFPATGTSLQTVNRPQKQSSPTDPDAADVTDAAAGPLPFSSPLNVNKPR